MPKQLPSSPDSNTNRKLRASEDPPTSSNDQRVDASIYSSDELVADEQTKLALSEPILMLINYGLRVSLAEIFDKL